MVPNPNLPDVSSIGLSQDTTTNSSFPSPKRIKIDTKQPEIHSETPNTKVFTFAVNTQKISITTSIDSVLSNRNTKLSQIVTRDFEVNSPVADFILGSPLEGLM